MRVVVALVAMMCLIATSAGASPLVLQRGDRSQEVRALQGGLSRVGLLDAPATGYFGTATLRAVKELQKQARLDVDGIAGPLTVRALESRLAAQARTTPAPRAVPQTPHETAQEPPATSQPPARPSSPAPSLGSGGREIVAYYCQYHAEDMLSYDSLKNYGAGVVDGVATFLYGVTPSGEIVGGDSSRVVELARKMGVTVLALVHNIYGRTFSGDLVHKVLTDMKLRAKVIDNIVSLLKDNRLGGVNIDFENVPPQDRDRYTDFVRALSARLKPEGLMLTLSVPAKKSENPNIAWSAPFDYWLLGEVADRIMIMTYDQHWSTSAAGPIAGVDWVEDMLEFATSAIPSEKILMGLATYGYDWQVGSRRGRAVPSYKALEQVKSGSIKELWDETAKVPYFTYTSGRYKRVVYYENAKSAAEKLDLVLKYRLGGIAIWRLGYEDPAIWKVIRDKLGTDLALR
jgi:spore germination protein YaaH